MRPSGSSVVEQSRYYKDENPILLRTGREAGSHAVLNSSLQGHWVLCVTFILMHTDGLQSVHRLGNAHLLPGYTVLGGGGQGVGTSSPPPYRPSFPAERTRRIGILQLPVLLPLTLGGCRVWLHPHVHSAWNPN